MYQLVSKVAGFNVVKKLQNLIDPNSGHHYLMVQKKPFEPLNKIKKIII